MRTEFAVGYLKYAESLVNQKARDLNVEPKEAKSNFISANEIEHTELPI